MDAEIDKEVAELTARAEGAEGITLSKDDIEMLTMDEEEAEEEDAKRAMLDNKDKILCGTVHSLNSTVN